MIKAFFIDPMSYNNLALYDYGLLNNYNRKNIEISFFGNRKYNFDPINGVKNKYVFSYSDKKGISKVISYLLSLLRIWFLVLIQKPNVMHIQWIRLPQLDYLLLKILRKISPNTKVVFTAHNIFPHNYSEKDKQQYLKYYNELDYIIVHSKKTLGILNQEHNIPKDKLVVNFHGILNFKRNDEKIKEISREFIDKHNLGNKTIISTLGIQSPYKGSDKIVKYFSNNDIPESVFLLIAGKIDKVDVSALNNKKNVAIINRFVSNDEFMAFMSITDLLLLPYREISQSGVLLTAINENVPFLVSDVGGLAEPLQIAEVGWAFKRNDFAEFDSKLEQLMNNKELLKEIKNDKKKWQKVQQSYSWDNIQKKTLDLYESISVDDQQV